MNSNYGLTFLAKDTDVAYSRNIKEKIYSCRIKEDLIGKKNEDKNKFRNELSSTIKRNKKETNRPIKAVKRKEGKKFRSNELEDKRSSQKISGKKNKKNQTEKKINDDGDTDGNKIDVAGQVKTLLTEIVSKNQKTNINEDDSEQETIFENESEVNLSGKIGKNDSVSDTKIKEDIEISLTKKQKNNLKNGGEENNNTKVLDELNNLDRGKTEKQNEKINVSIIDDNRRKLSKESMQFEKNNEQVANEETKEKGKSSLVREKKSNSKLLVSAENEKQTKKEIKKITGKTIDFQKLNIGNEAKKNNQPVSNEKNVNDFTLEKINNFGLASNNSTQLNETDEILKIEKQMDGERILKKEAISNIVKKILFTVKNNKSEVKIDLRPDILGNIKIRIRSENKHLKISISAETNSVKEIIENSIVQLKNDLQNSQMSLDKFDVFVDNSFRRDDPEKRKSKSFLDTFKVKANEIDNDLTKPIKNDNQMNNIYSGNNRIDYYA